jgi:hypothetical protein
MGKALFAYDDCTMKPLPRDEKQHHTTMLVTLTTPSSRIRPRVGDIASRSIPYRNKKKFRWRSGQFALDSKV